MNTQTQEILNLMDELGLLAVIKGMVKDIKPFREALVNWVDAQPVQYMFQLMDLGLPLATRISFLDPVQQVRLRDVVADMSTGDALSFLAALKQPGKVLDTQALIGEFNLKGQDIGKVGLLARQLLLDDPTLAGSPDRLTQAVRMDWKKTMRMAAIVEAPHNHHPVEVQPPKEPNRKKWPFQGFIDFQGLEIDVENKAGSVRSGTDPDGTKWSSKMWNHYGEIRGTEGADGDKLDVYVGPNHDSSLVVVVHQQDPGTLKFDEDKVMLGFDSEEEAIGAFKKQYDRPGYYQSHISMPIGQFWRWVKDDRNLGKQVKAAMLRIARRHTRAGVGTFKDAPGGGLVGWKVMRWDPVLEVAVSGANSRLTVPLRKGIVHRMPGQGIFLGSSKDYVFAHYGVHEQNAIIQYRFDSADLQSGSLEDREPEIGVSKATVLDFTILDEDGRKVQPAWLVRDRKDRLESLKEEWGGDYGDHLEEHGLEASTIKVAARRIARRCSASAGAFQKMPDGIQLIGWKVWQWDPEQQVALTGAKPATMNLMRGTTHRVVKQGLFLWPTKESAFYHFGVHDLNALVRYRFSAEDVWRGNLNAHNAQIGVVKGTVLDFTVLDNDGHKVGPDRAGPARQMIFDPKQAGLSREAGLREVWLKWVVQPIDVIWRHHKEFVSGPVDDAVDAIIKDLAPLLVKELTEREVEADVADFTRGALAGRADVAYDLNESEDFQAGYAWGHAHPDDFQGGDLPVWMRKQVVQESVRDFRHRITEQVVLATLKKAWHAVSPATTFKLVKEAVRRHGWKMGVFIALVECFEHFVLPSLLAWLFNNPKFLALVELPFGEIVYAVVFRMLGKVHGEADKLEPDGHLDWYEAQYGEVPELDAETA